MTGQIPLFPEIRDEIQLELALENHHSPIPAPRPIEAQPRPFVCPGFCPTCPKCREK